MLVNVRGTNGSGKTTTVRNFVGLVQLKGGWMKPIPSDPPRKRVRGYQLGVPGFRKPVFIVGDYAVSTGGCDLIKTQDEVCATVRDFAADGHVLFEGVLVSTIFGRYYDLSRELGGMIWAFLDTPIERSIEQVKKRNGGADFKEHKVVEKIRMISSARARAVAAGERVEDLPLDSAAETVFNWLGVADGEGL